MREYLDKSGLRPRDLPQIIRKLAATQVPLQSKAPARGLASVWSFYGPKGTAGTTTQAMNTAVELAGFGYKVLLVERALNQQPSSGRATGLWDRLQRSLRSAFAP
ncbi:MAG: hypothetical protein HY814_08510 [Candidatus Riflebacteria bacterium]|nr:hypothetical protein [Candidatus Riflebacteria bacterium]